LFFATCTLAADKGSQSHIKQAVNDAIAPIMKEHNIPGMAVAVTLNGERHLFNYGIASRETGQQVTENTIFEIGSVSKTFTATLASYAEIKGALSLSDKASKHLKILEKSAFDKISLVDLGTYTAGGLPLQFPDDVTDHAKMVRYFKNWHPEFASGTHRRYSNPSIGLFGYLAAKSLGEPFDQLMQRTLFPKLGLSNTYMMVPAERMTQYAYGYSASGEPIRVTPGMLDSEAYGVKTSSSDLIQFIEANMDGLSLDEALARAIKNTQVGYYKVGDMIQGLGWEMYPYPVSLGQLLAGSSTDVVFQAKKVSKNEAPLSPQTGMLVNKTGSTGGFGAYVAFVPGKRIGIAILANKNYPIPARIRIAHQILTALDKPSD
jgi:beta-lactamase class C